MQAGMVKISPRHAIPSSPNAILSLPPRHAGGIIGLGKDVSREQGGCHQATHVLYGTGAETCQTKRVFPSLPRPTYRRR